MPRGRKKAPENTEQQIEAIAEAREPGDEIEPLEDQAVVPPANDSDSMARESGSNSMRQVADNEEATQDSKLRATPRERFRSWVTDAANGYSRITDEKFQNIILQFDQKPSQEILTAIKDAGFHYQSDYDGHKNAWVRRNDYAGRLHVETIERLVRSPSNESERMPF